MGNSYLNVILTVLLISGIASAAYVSPALGTGGTNCEQYNASTFICPDGANMTINFVVSTPPNPYFGNFSVYASQGTNDFISVKGMNGEACVAAYGSATTCYVQLQPAQVMNGNGTMEKHISLSLVSQLYPQVHYSEAINVTVLHYLTQQQSAVSSLYNNVYREYSNMSDTYSFYCNQNRICSQSATDLLNGINQTLYNATYDIFNSKLGNAYTELSKANYTINSKYKNYSDFVAYARGVYGSVEYAHSLISNVTKSVAANNDSLSRCSFSNGTGYDSYIRGYANALKSFNPESWNNKSASNYVASAYSFSNNASNLFRICSIKSAIGFEVKAPQQGNSAINLNLNPNTLLMIAGAIVVLYVALVINDKLEVSRMRRNYNEHDTRKEEKSEPAPKEDKYESEPPGKLIGNAQVEEKENGKQVNEPQKNEKSEAQAPTSKEATQKDSDEDDAPQELERTFDDWLSSIGGDSQKDDNENASF